MILINNQEVIEVSNYTDFYEQIKEYDFIADDVPFVEIEHKKIILFVH